MDNIEALSCYYRRGIIKNDREYRTILSYANESGKQVIADTLESLKNQSIPIADIKENKDSYIESHVEWFQRRGQRLVGLTQKGIKEINKNEITKLVLPREKDGYKITGLADTFFDCFEEDIPRVNELVVTSEIVQSVKEYQLFPGVRTIKILRIVGEGKYDITYGTRSIIRDSVEYLDIIDNDYYQSIDGIVFDKSGKKIIFYPRGRMERQYKIPNYVEAIGRLAFQSATNIKEFAIPAQLQDIGWRAFWGCNIEILDISGNMKNIDAGFCGAQIQKELILREGIEYIGEEAFRYCEAKEVVFPKSLKTIAKYAFGDSTSKFVFLSNETDISPRAFANCSYTQFEDASNIIRRKIVDYGYSPYDCGFIEYMSEYEYLMEEFAINIIRTYYGSDYPLLEKMPLKDLRQVLKRIQSEQ